MLVEEVVITWYDFFSYYAINENIVGKIYGTKEDIKIMKENNNYIFQTIIII